MAHQEPFGQHAQALAALGYSPLPLAGKRPMHDNWQHPDPDRLSTLIYAHAGANVGIATRGLAVLDADILDKEVARHMRAFILRMLRPEDRKLLFRIGKEPKWLCMFRASEGNLPKRSSALFADARGREHRLEWLRDGQQFLAFGIHPDTRKPMRWPNGDPISTGTRFEDLPVITEAQIDAINTEFERVAGLAGWTKVSGAAAGVIGGSPASPVAGLTLEHAADALGHLPADSVDQYASWIETGMALHHQFEGAVEAFEVWDTWSAASEKYDGEAATWAKWQGFDAERPGGVSMRSILMHAEQEGWERPRGVEAAPAAAEDFPLLDPPDFPSGNLPDDAPVASANSPDRESFDLEADAADKPPFPTVPLADLYTADIAEPEHVIHPFLPRGVVTLLGAHGGAGKTMLALVQAACVATGREFMGHETVQCPVVFYSAEDDGEVVRWRLQRICQCFGIDPAELDGTLTVYDVTSLNPTLYGEGSMKGMRYGSTTKTYRKLREAAVELGAGLVIIDNASDVFEANENERARVRGFMRSLQRMAVETGGAVELIAHIDKAAAKKPGTPEGYSGSTAWHNSARSRLYLRADSLDRLVLEHQKANFSRRGADVHMAWEYGVPVLDTPEMADDGEGTGTEAWAEHKRCILGLVAEFYDRGEYIPVSFNAPGNAFKALANEPAYPGLDRSALQSLMRDMQRAGDLEDETYWSDNRKERHRWRVTEKGHRAVEPKGVTDLSWLDVIEGFTDQAEASAPSAPS